jgi:predicted phage baseplate assembly protein
MPLPTPRLDDRRFQDIVDQAKSLIPRYCPEWTDHNVSDPGVALIELFAWMTDMLLYRVNQVPEKMYIQFLELIGVRLEPPRAAHAPVTFYLSAPQPVPITIPEGTEVATIRTETAPAIIFTTETALIIRPPKIVGAYTRDARRSDGGGWVTHDLRQLGLPGRRLPLFPSAPAPSDAFYIALESDHSMHVLTLTLECELAGGAGINPDSPPLEWQVWQSGALRWAACEIEYDGTGGFNRSGEIVLHLPAMAQGVFQEQTAFWLRCRLTDAQAGPNGYRVSPDIESLHVDARGGTASARHAVTILNETLGRSEGVPGETYRLTHTPLLARDPQRDYLITERPDGESEIWSEVRDFAESGPTDRHFTLDDSDGTLALGPSLLQPNGDVYAFGQVPVKGSVLRFSRYQWGGGVTGNVQAEMLAVLKSSIPYVARVVNRRPAAGGQDAQTLEDAILRAPQVLRTRTRAVTADDYEYLACQTPGVARTRCLAPGAQPGAPSDPRPGQVVVLVLPQVESVQGRLTPEALTLSAELRERVLAYLEVRRVLGSTLDVRAPQYLVVSVEARLRLPERSDPRLGAQAQTQAEAALYRYLNPFTGGPDGKGWPFGRDLHVSEIYALLQRQAGVEFVEEIQITLGEDASRTPVATPRLTVPPNALLCSGIHRIRV